jgi:hypothetical protein
MQEYATPFALLISALLLAWILSFFGVDKYFINAVHESTGKTITVASYYMFFFIVAIVSGGLLWVKDLFSRHKGCSTEAERCLSQLKRVQQSCGDCASSYE